MKLNLTHKALIGLALAGGLVTAYSRAQPPQRARSAKVTAPEDKPAQVLLVDAIEQEPLATLPSLLAVDSVDVPVDVVIERPNRQDIARLEEDAVALTVDYFRSVDDFKEVDDAKEAREQQKADLEESLAALRREFQTANTEARVDIRKKILATVGKIFDLRIEEQKARFDSLQAQLKKVQDQLDRRIELRESIVDKRVVDLLGEPDELKWDEDPVLARSLNYSFQPSASSRSSDLQRRLKLEEYRAQELRYERARQAASVEERLSEFDASRAAEYKKSSEAALREAEARKKGAVEALRSKRDGEKRVLEDRVIRIPDDIRAEELLKRRKPLERE